MRSILTTLIICLTSLQAFSQVQPGGIAFLSMQCDAPDGFAIVTLQDIPAGTTISFTDNGWSGSALFTNENTVIWTAPATDVPIGTVIIFREDTISGAGHNTELITGPGTATGELAGLSIDGDQILAYTGTSANPTFVAAISTNMFLSTCNITGSGNSNYTCLPDPLEEGVNALAITGDSTNYDNTYLFTPDMSGSAADILAIIMDPENWEVGDLPADAGFAMWPAWTFNFAVPDPSEISFQSGFFSLSEGGSAQIINLSISPASFGTQTVTIALSGVAGASDLTATPAIASNSITITIPNGSTSASFTLAALGDGITEGTETGTLTISTISPGLFIGAGNTLNYEITEPEGISFVSFSSTSQTITEGQSDITIQLDIQPAPSSQQTFSIQLTEQSSLTSADYTTNPVAVSGLISVTVDAGLSSYSFTFHANDDSEIESPEVLSLSLTGFSSNLQAGLNSTADLTILDNDATPVVSDLYINEVMASNTGTITDENGEFDDWIEIYNDAATPADLAGLSITDDITQPTKYVFPTGSASTVIEAGGFKLIWADNTTAQGPLHTNFTLTPAGEYVGLYAATGEVIDSLSYEQLGPDESYGYTSEVDGELDIFTEGFTTPNVSNTLASVPTVQAISLNIFPNPAIELVQLNFTAFSTKAELHVFDIRGNLVIHQLVNEGTTQLSLSTNTFASGTYLVRLGSGKNRIYQKLIVKH